MKYQRRIKEMYDLDHRSVLIAILIFVVSLLFAMGCNKVTEENYDKIQKGMYYHRVVSILGDDYSIYESGGGTTRTGLRLLNYEREEEKLDIKNDGCILSWPNTKELKKGDIAVWVYLLGGKVRSKGLHEFHSGNPLDSAFPISFWKTCYDDCQDLF